MATKLKKCDMKEKIYYFVEFPPEKTGHFAVFTIILGAVEGKCNVSKREMKETVKNTKSVLITFSSIHG